MFNKKNRSDYQVRFQNSRFQKRLKIARTYKRNRRIIPETDWGIFLSKIGLGSWRARFATASILLALVYFVYVPNLFFIRQITINGVVFKDKPAIESLVNSFLTKKLPWPQKNLILLSKPKLSQFLQKNDTKILSINSIIKKLPNTLEIDIAPRIDEFVVLTASSAYTVSNDGIATGIYQASATLPSGLIPIKLTSEPDIITGQNVLPEGAAGFISGVEKQLPDITKLPGDYFLLKDFESSTLNLYEKNGLRIIFDYKSGLKQNLDRLRSLFSQFSAADSSKLFYIDMRFQDKAYVCYKNTPCTADINLPNPSATSTPNNSPN